jgi:hypothetical protein
MDESSNKSTTSASNPAPDLLGYLRPLPEFTKASPAVVLVHDKIRRELDEVDGFEEFCLFAREYPRCYRFHFDGAKFRLRSLHDLLQRIRANLATQVSEADGDTFEVGLSDIRVAQVYWDFESFLSEVSITLDLLARVVGPAFPQESPPSFNRLCKWTGSHPLLDVFRRAQKRWVNRVKDYRDCFTHYTPVDTMLMVVLRRYPDRWEVRAKLPTNPNVREILGFRFSRRVELLRYALRVYADLVAFDAAVARTLSRLYAKKNYPVRRDRLFFVGRRERAW